MDINDKKLKRTSKIINWLIAIVLGIFLILLSNTIIDDMDSSVESPYFNEYRNNDEDEKLEQERTVIRDQVNVLETHQSNIRKMINVARQNKEQEQQSFDNWVTTRSTLGSPNQDKEVIQRAQKLDDLLKIEQDWQRKSDSIQTEINILEKHQIDISNRATDAYNQANELYSQAMKTYDMKVFLLRLLFVAPILALGIFFFIRYRNHKFSPLFMGFSLFSLYAFFVGLVPYLPSYGGYIRYSVGVLLTIGLGYYAIKRIRDYSERKKAELEASGSERAKKLETGIAERAFNNHICPSCGKDFFLKNWESPLSVDKTTLQTVSNYCRYCGLQLMKNCTECGHSNYAHLPYCASCGKGLKE